MKPRETEADLREKGVAMRTVDMPTVTPGPLAPLAEAATTALRAKNHTVSTHFEIISVPVTLSNMKCVDWCMGLVLTTGGGV